MRKWTTWEMRFIKLAVKAINSGASVYSQVYLLYFGVLKYRTWVSIRSKINRLRKQQLEKDGVNVISTRAENELLRKELDGGG